MGLMLYIFVVACTSAMLERKPAISIRDYTDDGEHVCAGAGTRCDVCFGPLKVDPL